MTLAQERAHPASMDFVNQRKAVLLRDVHALPLTEIAKQVVNLRGERPTARTVANMYWQCSEPAGRRAYKYSQCGRKPWKIDAHRALPHRGAPAAETKGRVHGCSDAASSRASAWSARVGDPDPQGVASSWL